MVVGRYMNITILCPPPNLRIYSNTLIFKVKSSVKFRSVLPLKLLVPPTEQSISNCVWGGGVGRGWEGQGTDKKELRYRREIKQYRSSRSLKL